MSREYEGQWGIVIVAAAAAGVICHERNYITVCGESEGRQWHSTSLPTHQSWCEHTFTSVYSKNPLFWTKCSNFAPKIILACLFLHLCTRDKFLTPDVTGIIVLLATHKVYKVKDAQCR